MLNYQRVDRTVLCPFHYRLRTAKDFVGVAAESGAACSCRVFLVAVFVLPALLLNHSFMFGEDLQDQHDDAFLAHQVELVAAFKGSWSRMVYLGCPPVQFCIFIYGKAEQRLFAMFSAYVDV